MESVNYQLIGELRRNYQIPPYVSDETLDGCIERAKGHFEQLARGCTQFIGADPTLKGLVMDYAYYDHKHAVNDFLDRFKSVILTWQVNMVVHDE